MILGLDPGTFESALVVYDPENNCVPVKMKEGNPFVLKWLTDNADKEWPLAIEKVASYGLPIGETTMETIYWSGIFAHAYGLAKVKRVTRGDVKMHLCHAMRAKDSNVRQALVDRFGAARGPILKGITSDMWSALAVAVTASETVC